MYDSALNVYLRCDRNHPNPVPMRERDAAVGRACAACGRPLQAMPAREPGPRRMGGPRHY